MRVKLRSIDKNVNVTCKSFAEKIAKVLDDLKSSHVYFIMQQAYGEISWEDAQAILDQVLNKKNGSTN